MTTKLWVAVMAIFALVYVVLFGSRAISLLSEPNLIPQLIGIFMLIFPLVAIWSIYIEIQFGVASEKLARELIRQNFPQLDLDLRPSGRATAESARAAFETAKEQLEADESDWRLWFRLGEAYEASGDRKRARAAIRAAIRLAANHP